MTLRLSKFKFASSGFSLIELLVVVALISILAGLGAVSYSQAQKTSRNGQRQSDLKKISLALENYYADHRFYPNSSQFDCLTGSGAGCAPPVNNYITTLPKDPLDQSSYTYAVNADLQGYTLSTTKEGFSYSITKPD